MSNHLLIDGNSIGFAAQSMNKLHTGKQETQAIFGFLRSLRVLCDENPDAEPIIFWDGRSWRFDHYPEYKDGREKDPKQKSEREAYKTQRPHIAKAVALLGVRQEMAGNMEADDLIARTSWGIEPPQHATIVSGDRDLLQLVKPGVDWLNPIRLPGGKLPKLLRCTHQTFAEDTGYEDAGSYVMGKAMLGDASDNFKGIAGIGTKAAPLVVKTWPKLSELISDIKLRGDAAIPPHLGRYKSKLKAFAGSEEAIRTYLRDYKLMRLSDRFLPPPVNHKVQKLPFSPNGFRTFCNELGFVSIIKNFDDWVRPFAKVEMKEAA